MNRRRFLAAAAAAAGGVAAYGALVEPRRLQVTQHALEPRPGDSRARLVIAQITDLHIHAVGRVHRAIAARLRQIRPHLVVFTGDSVDSTADLPVFAEFLALLDAKTPKYAILGNWEHWGHIDRKELAALYERHNGRLLVNETAVHAHAGRRVGITGLDDMVGGTPDLRAGLAGAEPADARLLLAHSPGYRNRLHADARAVVAGGSQLSAGVEAAAAEFRAMLSGHTHGGQVSLFGWAPMLPPGSAGYVRGWFRGDGRVPLYVSRGIGESVLPVRLGSVPELAVFTLPL